MRASVEDCANGACEEHYHAHDPIFTTGATQQQQQSQTQLLQQQQSATSNNNRQDSDLTIEQPVKVDVDPRKKGQEVAPPAYDPQDHGFRRIIRNFTPS